MAEAWFRNMKDLEEFTDRLLKEFKGIVFSVQHVLEDLKRESFLIDYEQIREVI